MLVSAPVVEDATRERLTARFGLGVTGWFEVLPPLLSSLETRWNLEWLAPIPRGSVSVVIRCLSADGSPAVLKVSPDRKRLANEAAALGRWPTVHTPSVLAVDEEVGALLIEGIEPGTPLVESLVYPDIETAAELLTSLHSTGAIDPTYPSLAERVAYLFKSGAKPYTRKPEVAQVVDPELYERGRRLATRLAEEASPTALLHGDLTPSNLLDGGVQRGLVAIDPAPCLGDDLGFDAIDLALWQADGVDVIGARIRALAPAIGVDAGRLFDWCSGFAAMTALEMAEAGRPSEDLRACLALAAEVVGPENR
jgi:streptomycin 6-kinase